MTRSQLWWFWGELVAMAIGLFVIVMGGWVVHDERWLWVGVVIGAMTFIVTTIHGPTLWRERKR